jgi:hypothetical protein
MPRLLLRRLGALRHLASINVTHDGSIKLDLVREGVSKEGFEWQGGAEQGPVEHRKNEERATKSITIHTSGRINYHFGGHAPVYVPCLLDLEAAVWVVTYVIPSADRLDAVKAERADDSIADIPDNIDGPIAFEFGVLPAVLPAQSWETGSRFGVEGLYALAWGGQAGTAGFARDEIPSGAFTTVQPIRGLAEQAVPEEVVFLRFKRAMYANDVAVAVANAPNRDEITAADVEASIQAGPGLFPPNKEGVWTLITSVPMRIAPLLNVAFEDYRYRAEVVDLRVGDTRLSTVRVRFKVFDTKANAYVKHRVAIRHWELDARL